MSDFWKASSQQIVRRIVLEGKVQGVGCRAQVMELVTDIGHINGFVRNMSDGRVEVCVKGDDWRVDGLVKTLRNKMHPPVEIERVLEEELSSEAIKLLGIGNGFIIKRS